MATVIKIVEWSNGGTYKAYESCRVGSDFLSKFGLIKYDDGSPLAYTVLQQKLSPFDVSPQYYYPSDSDIRYEYPYSSNRVIKWYDLPTPPTVIGFSSSPFSTFYKPQTVRLGDTFKLKELFDSYDSGSLTYADGVQNRPVCQVQTKYCSLYDTLGEQDEYVIDNNTPNPFTITYQVKLATDKVLTLSYQVQVSDQYSNVVRVEFENAPMRQEAGKALSLNAYHNYTILKCYDKNNNVVKTFNNSELSQVISQYPQDYGTTIGPDLFVDDYITKEFTISLTPTLSFKATWKFVVDYYEPILKLNSTGVTKSYFIGGSYGDSLTFDLSNLVITAVKHDNSTELGSVSTVVFTGTNDVDCWGISCDVSSIPSGSKTFPVSITKTLESQLLYSNVKDLIIEVTKYEIVGIKVSGKDTTKYYDNNVDHFHYPTGLTIQYLYSDGTLSGTPEDLRYYLQQPSQATYDNYLTTNTSDPNYANSIITSGYNKIYVYSNAYDSYGYYDIEFVADTISSITMTNNVNVVLGNRLSKYRDSISLTVSYISGITKALTSYDFVNNDLIMSALSEVKIVVEDTEYTLDISKFTFSNPSISSTEFNLSKFSTTYNNNADSIDCSNLTLKIYYEDSEYVQETTFAATSTNIFKDKYRVECDGLVGYAFNGTQKLDVEMGSYAEMTLNLKCIYLDQYTGVEKNVLLPFSVIEITDIIGLSLLNAKREYSIGEHFLNDDDDTKIMITYKDTNENTRTFTTYLKSGLTGINIFPLKNTQFTRVENGKVVKITAANNYNVSCEYTIDVASRYIYSETKNHDLIALWIENGENGSKYYLVDRYIGGKETTQIKNNKRVLAVGMTINDIVIYGYLEDVLDDTKNARVILYKDYIPTIEGANNITVKYPCYIEGNADYINKTHFGIMFGSNNSRNRLFVSGNKNYCNYDWHSGDITEQYLNDESMLVGNLAYFEDDSYCAYGETDNSVVGYDIVSNDKLLVLKSHSDKETTIYFRQPTLINAIDAGGNSVTGLDGESLYQEAYTTIKGNNTNAGVSHKTIANFNGDTLFLDDNNQLLGLDLTGIIGDNQRYASSRSYFIDKDLAPQDLSNALVWTNNQHLFLATEEKVYVTHFETKSNNQYEWFVLDLKGITTMFEFNKKIYFANGYGELYSFNDEYCDNERVFVGKAGTLLATLGEDENIVTISSAKMSELNYKIALNESAKVKCKIISSSKTDNSYMYYQFAIVSNTTTGTYDFLVRNVGDDYYLELVGAIDSIPNETRRQEVLKQLADKWVYLNHLNDESDVGASDGNILKTPYKKYKLKSVEQDLYTEVLLLYKLYDENDEEVSVEDLYRCSLCYRLDGEYDVVNIDETESTFQLAEDDKIIDLVAYANQKTSRNFQIEISVRKNVQAHYITKPYDMGYLTYYKTIWSWTMTNDTKIPSELDIAYCNNKIPFENMKVLSTISKDKMYVDFTDLTFKSVDFDKTLVPRTYTNARVLSNLKFICFGFKNYNDTNAVLSSLSIIYTLPFPSYSGD